MRCLSLPQKPATSVHGALGSGCTKGTGNNANTSGALRPLTSSGDTFWL
jgi:hypothetical protein